MPRLLAISCLVAGCVAIDPEGGEEPRAVLVGAIDTNAYCDMVGVIEVDLRATLVGCVDAGPCMLPDEPPRVVGDRYTCPATHSSALLGVEVDADGRYTVEAVAILTTQEEQGQQCYAAPGEAPPVLVTVADVDAGAHIMLEPTGSPCP
jgi:hypothetical protein